MVCPMSWSLHMILKRRSRNCGRLVKGSAQKVEAGTKITIRLISRIAVTVGGLVGATHLPKIAGEAAKVAVEKDYVALQSNLSALGI